MLHGLEVKEGGVRLNAPLKGVLLGSGSKELVEVAVAVRTFDLKDTDMV